MAAKGGKGIERLFRECAEADNGRAWHRIVESTFRCAAADGLVVNAAGQVVGYDKDQVHPGMNAARALIFSHVMGMPSQKVEHTIEHQIPFIFDPAMLQALAVETVEVEEYDETGDIQTRLIVASDPDAPTMAEVHGDE